MNLHADIFPRKDRLGLFTNIVKKLLLCHDSNVSMFRLIQVPNPGPKSKSQIPNGQNYGLNYRQTDGQTDQAFYFNRFYSLKKLLNIEIKLFFLNYEFSIVYTIFFLRV